MVGKATFQAAVNRGGNRIVSGGNIANNAASLDQGAGVRGAAVRAIANRMVYMANQMFPACKLGPANTNATFAIGLLFYANLTQGVEALVSGAKGVNEQETRFYETLVSLSAVDTFEHFGTQMVAPQIWQRETTESFMHSEMAVVSAVNKDAAKDRLAVICFGKRVCSPCGGQMNGYTIPHCSVLADGNGVNTVEFACDPATQGWRHPYSRATYSHANNSVSGYQYPGAFSLSALQPNRPGRFN